MKMMKEEPCKEIYKKKSPRAAASGSSKEYTEEAINSYYQDNFHKIIAAGKNPSNISATEESQTVDDYIGDNSPSYSIGNCEAVRKTPPKTTVAAAKKLNKACEIDDKLLQRKYEIAGKKADKAEALLVKKDENTEKEYNEERISYSLENYSEDVENYDDDENALKLLQEKYEAAGKSPPPASAKLLVKKDENEEKIAGSDQSLTSLPEYAIDIEQMDDDDNNLLKEKHQSSRNTVRDAAPVANDGDESIDMKLPGAIAIGANKKASYRSQESIMNDSSLSLGCHSEEFDKEVSSSTLVDRELELERLDRRVKEVLSTRTIAFAEEIDLNGRMRILCCIGSFLVILVVASVVLVAIFTRNSADNNMVDYQPQPTTSPTNTQKPTMEMVVKRGVLRCVVPNQAPGFAIINTTTGKHEGFEVDSCLSVAAAIMGTAYDIEIVEMSWKESFFALANGSVDLIARGVTHTMERDIYKSDTRTGFSFTVPYLYDGLGFGGMPSFVECADNLQAYGICSELKICVLEQSTHHKILEELFPRGSLAPSAGFINSLEKLVNGNCNVIAGEKNAISEQSVRDQGYAGEYFVGKTLISKEPLAIVTRADDYKFSQIVNWVLRAQFLAEAMNIKQDTAADFSKISPFGDKYNDMFINAISAVGNYGERYERHLEKVLPRGGLNMLYLDKNQLNDDSHNNGLIYSYPFGPIDKNGPGPTVGSRLSKITERGILRCGVTEIRNGFATFDIESRKWKGLDIDYCKAIAAAIFGGVNIESTVEYINLTNKNTFDALITDDDDDDDDDVDIVGGANIDIEANIDMGVSFSQPYFYEYWFKSRSLATYGKDDSQFGDFVFWVVSSTFYAEEQNITSSNIFNAMPEVRIFGPQYYEMFRDAILVTGNYGDMYDRNLQSIIPRSGRTNLNSPMIGPQINPFVGF